MKPGDLIEWFYKRTGSAVLPDEELWSSTMEQWVPIGGVHLLVSVVDGVMSWLPVGRDKRLLHACVDDVFGPAMIHLTTSVAPRVRG